MRNAANGEITGYVAVERDVTRELLLEAQIRQAQKLEAVGQLAAGVAHDFNNLLTIILGFASLIEPDSTDEASLAQIVLAGQRGADLTRQLLTLSRQSVVQPRAVDLNEALLEASELLGRVIGEDVTFVCDPGQGLSTVWADAGHIQQVIMNLVLNGRDAMPHGGQLTLSTRKVTVRDGHGRCDVLPFGEYAVLRVRDTGHGMDAETRSRIFEPFFTTKDVGAGTGLGLATVLGIVKQSAGHIFVESTVGSGTCFEVYFSANTRNAFPFQPVESPVESPPSTGGETLLLVEDQAEVRGLLHSALSKAGYEVLVASRPSEALAAWGSAGENIRLLVTDVVMPEMNGDELADRLRARDGALKVLFLSGYAPDPEFAARLNEPNVDYLAKPFKLATLLDRVREMLSLAVR